MERLTVFEITIPRKIILSEWKNLTQKWFNQETALYKPNKKSNYFESLLSMALVARVKGELPDFFWDSGVEYITRLRRSRETFTLQIILIPKLGSVDETSAKVFFQKIGKDDAIFRFEKTVL
jgi:hypothetical protein